MVVRLVLAALILATISAGYMVLARQEARELELLSASRQEALAARADAISAGMPTSALAADTAQAARLAAAAGPSHFPYLDRDWKAWVARQRAAYAALAEQVAVDRSAYQAGLASNMTDQVASLRATTAHWTEIGGDPVEIAAVTAGLDTAPPSTITGLQARLALVASRARAAAAGLAQQVTDNATQATYSAAELPAATADPVAARKQATDVVLYDLQGDMGAAVHYNVPGLERLQVHATDHTAMLGAATTAQALAGAIAWLRVDQDHLTAAMIAPGAMPAKAIWVSLDREELRAYENGARVRATLVTSGRPELPTDVGSFKVLRKNSPWTMHSPFPLGSPYWYPDTRVNYVLWFNDDGSGLHDAYWRSKYGPGTNGPGRSGGTHGCVNIPLADTVWLYNWAPVGTPVTIA